MSRICGNIEIDFDTDNIIDEKIFSKIEFEIEEEINNFMFSIADRYGLDVITMHMARLVDLDIYND